MGELVGAKRSTRDGFPADDGLRDFGRLFDEEWVWRAYCSRYGAHEVSPRRIRLRQLSYVPGRRAVVSCAAEWDADEFLPEERFAVEIGGGGSPRVFAQRDDERLPGLRLASTPEGAAELLSRHVLMAPARRVLVDTVRYRPGSRAVLRHKVGKVRFYARVMRPGRLGRLVGAAAVAEQAGFALPRLAGAWAEGGVAWLSEMPGRNMRDCIRQGDAPDVAPLLDGLARLWDAPVAAGSGVRAFDLRVAHRRARRVFRQTLREDAEGLRALGDATRRLDAFARDWMPTAVAHNDLYDDQLLVMGDGRLALVDFDEAGLGDPLLDVGNFLAHLRWAARFGAGERARAASGAYHGELRDAALARFGWDARELDAREAACLFRVCTNPIRHLAADWRRVVREGLALAGEVCDSG